MSDLRSHLQNIYDVQGKLTPELVVEVARDPGHPLHHRFEWNNSLAGEAYRRQQASELIRSVQVTYAKAPDGQAQRVRAWHSVRYTDDGVDLPSRSGYRYEPAAKVATDPLLARLVLADMEREWRSLRRRYEQFEQFWKMIRDEVGDQAA